MGWLTAPLGFYPEDPGYTGTFVVKLLHASPTDVHGGGTVIVCTESALRTDIFSDYDLICTYLSIIGEDEETSKNNASIVIDFFSRILEVSQPNRELMNRDEISSILGHDISETLSILSFSSDRLAV